jgi:hypothetical protein
MRTWSRFLPVATTQSPAFHAFLAVPAPIPLPAPVMHQTLFTVVLLSTVSFADQALLHRAGQKAGAIGADCGRHTTDRNVCVDCPDSWHPFPFKNDACKIPKEPRSNAVELHSASTGQNMQAVERFKARLLLDSRVVDLPLSYNPIVVALFSLKPFFFNGLK